MAREGSVVCAFPAPENLRREGVGRSSSPSKRACGLRGFITSSGEQAGREGGSGLGGREEERDFSSFNLRLRSSSPVLAPWLCISPQSPGS